MVRVYGNVYPLFLCDLNYSWINVPLYQYHPSTALSGDAKCSKLSLWNGVWFRAGTHGTLIAYKLAFQSVRIATSYKATSNVRQVKMNLKCMEYIVLFAVSVRIKIHCQNKRSKYLSDWELTFYERCWPKAIWVRVSVLRQITWVQEFDDTSWILATLGCWSFNVKWFSTLWDNIRECTCVIVTVAMVTMLRGFDPYGIFMSVCVYFFRFLCQY